MKILHITPAYYPATYWGGPIFSVYYMNNALAQLPGVELKVLTTDSAGPKVSDRLSEEEKHTPFPYKVIFSKRIAGACVAPGLLWKLLRNIMWANVVHLTATFSFPTIPVLLFCWLMRKPVVWSLRGALLDDQNRHDFDPQTYTKRFIKSLWLTVCRQFIRTDRVTIHVTTEQEREAIVHTFPGARFATIPNGVAVPETVPVRKHRHPNEMLRLMFMGRLAPKKGIENLLQAIAKLDMPVQLNVYGSATVGQGGDHYGEDLIALAKKLGLLNKYVYFRGQVNGEAKQQAFINADVCVIPSYSENFCIVVAEAMSMGVPVIVSDRLAWSKVAKRGCGLVVGNDPDSLAKAIEKISKMNLNKMGEIGRLWMKQEYGWNAIANSVYDVYRRLLPEKDDVG